MADTNTGTSLCFKPVNIFGSLSKTAAEITPKTLKIVSTTFSVSFLYAPPLPLQMAVQLWHLQGPSHPAVEIDRTLVNERA